MKMLIILTIVLLALTNIGHAQQFASARIFEMVNEDYSKIIVVYEDGTSETIPLKGYTAHTLKKNTPPNLIDNQKTINTFLTDMGKKGYKISNILSHAEGPLVERDFFIIFVKEEEAPSNKD